MAGAFFVRVTGQAMNVGDSVLRRAYIDSLRGLGAAHLFIRQMPQGYIDGLRLQPHDTVYRSESEWKKSFRRVAADVPTTWAFNAGEMQFSRFYAQEIAGALHDMRRARRSGGRSVMLGVSVRSPGGRWAPIVKPLLRGIDRVSWRDALSREWTGTGAVAPDWAFLEGHPDASETTDAERGLLAVTLRGDRKPPSDEWIAAVRSIADANALEPIVLSQVEADTAPMAEVAHRLGSRFVGMPAGISHVEQEETVRQLYRTSSAVVSDRLHALVMGATEGAVPLGLADEGAAKAARHFDVVGVKGTGIPTERFPTTPVDLSDAARHRLREAIARGRADLAALARSIAPLPVTVGGE
jgi:polysaccharide pyruvyl transferase WcaK-like protein